MTALGERMPCQTAPMICMTILYPKADDSRFDMDYYTSTHMPMVAKAFGGACQVGGRRRSRAATTAQSAGS